MYRVGIILIKKTVNPLFFNDHFTGKAIFFRRTNLKITFETFKSTYFSSKINKAAYPINAILLNINAQIV